MPNTHNSPFTIHYNERRLYEGACWCQCPEPFTGNHCEEKKAHVKFQIVMFMESIMKFHETVLRQIVAKAMDVDVSGVNFLPVRRFVGMHTYCPIIMISLLSLRKDKCHILQDGYPET